MIACLQGHDGQIQALISPCPCGVGHNDLFTNGLTVHKDLQNGAVCIGHDVQSQEVGAGLVHLESHTRLLIQIQGQIGRASVGHLSGQEHVGIGDLRPCGSRVEGQLIQLEDIIHVDGRLGLLRLGLFGLRLGIGLPLLGRADIQVVQHEGLVALIQRRDGDLMLPCRHGHKTQIEFGIGPALSAVGHAHLVAGVHAVHGEADGGALVIGHAAKDQSVGTGGADPHRKSRAAALGHHEVGGRAVGDLSGQSGVGEGILLPCGGGREGYLIELHGIASRISSKLTVYVHQNCLALTKTVAGLYPDLIQRGQIRVIHALGNMVVEPLGPFKALAFGNAVLHWVTVQCEQQAVARVGDHRGLSGRGTLQALESIYLLLHVVVHLKAQLLTGLKVTAVIQTQTLLGLLHPREGIIEAVHDHHIGTDGVHGLQGTLQGGLAADQIVHSIPVRSVGVPTAVNRDRGAHNFGLTVLADSIDGRIAALGLPLLVLHEQEHIALVGNGPAACFLIENAVSVQVSVAEADIHAVIHVLGRTVTPIVEYGPITENQNQRLALLRHAVDLLGILALKLVDLFQDLLQCLEIGSEESGGDHHLRDVGMPLGGHILGGLQENLGIVDKTSHVALEILACLPRVVIGDIHHHGIKAGSSQPVQVLLGHRRVDLIVGAQKRGSRAENAALRHQTGGLLIQRIPTVIGSAVDRRTVIHVVPRQHIRLPKDLSGGLIAVVGFFVGLIAVVGFFVGLPARFSGGIGFLRLYVGIGHRSGGFFYHVGCDVIGSLRTIRSARRLTASNKSGHDQKSCQTKQQVPVE